jgi:hypothetical protein
MQFSRKSKSAVQILGSVWGKFGIGLGPFSGVGARKTAIGKRFEFGDQPN